MLKSVHMANRRPHSSFGGKPPYSYKTLTKVLGVRAFLYKEQGACGGKFDYGVDTKAWCTWIPRQKKWSKVGRWHS